MTTCPLKICSDLANKRCDGSGCSWWNDDAGMCSVTALSIAMGKMNKRKDAVAVEIFR